MNNGNDYAETWLRGFGIACTVAFYAGAVGLFIAFLVSVL